MMELRPHAHLHDQSNYAELVPKLRVDQWLRDRVTRAAQSGRVVIIPDRYLRIERWHGTGWTELDPTTGAGGYLIVGVMTYMREGEAGNTSIRLGPEHITVGGHAAQPLDMEEGWREFWNYSWNLSEDTRNRIVNKTRAGIEIGYHIWNLYKDYPSIIGPIITGWIYCVKGACRDYRYLVLLGIVTGVAILYIGPNVAAIIQRGQILMDGGEFIL
jgi:hypothetical protein